MKLLIDLQEATTEPRNWILFCCPQCNYDIWKGQQSPSEQNRPEVIGNYLFRGLFALFAGGTLWQVLNRDEILKCEKCGHTMEQKNRIRATHPPSSD